VLIATDDLDEIKFEGNQLLWVRVLDVFRVLLDLFGQKNNNNKMSD